MISYKRNKKYKSQIIVDEFYVLNIVYKYF